MSVTLNDDELAVLKVIYIKKDAIVKSAEAFAIAFTKQMIDLEVEEASIVEIAVARCNNGTTDRYKFTPFNATLSRVQEKFVTTDSLTTYIHKIIGDSHDYC